MTTEDIPQDIQDIPEDIPNIPDIPMDSYDELAMDAVQVDVPQSNKRGRGRPPGSRNRPKIPEPEPELEPEPETPPPTKRKKPRPVPLTPPLDVEFTEGYGGAGPPKKAIRMSREKTSSQDTTSAGRSLLDLVAEASNRHAERERDRRRAFYENYLPI